jgi:L-ascorbate metabolism protein UlaG (beta-lactamase superfamily)
MKYTYYGHSSFMVEISGHGDGSGIKLLFDPFISGNELAKNVNISAIEPDYIFLSHGHFDHIADCVTIAEGTGATVVSSWEIYEWLSKKGLKKLHPMNTGGQWHFGGFAARAVTAQHSSGLPDGSYGGNPMGFIITSMDGNFYYSGDTALTLDMQLIPRWAKLNFAVLPIGDNFTMGYADAATAATMIGSPVVIGVHYDTFGFIRIDHDQAKQAFEKEGCTLHLVPIGDSIHLKTGSE